MSRLKDGECAWEEDIERERERGGPEPAADGRRKTHGD